MPLIIKIYVKDNSILANVNSTKAKVLESMRTGLQLGGDELRDYIKYDLLSGQILNKRSGQLASSVWIKRSANTLKIFFRGLHKRDRDSIPNSVIAAILEHGTDTGTNRGWYKPNPPKGITAYHFMRTGLRDKKARILQLVRHSIYTGIRK